jgi:hypothetical protein
MAAARPGWVLPALALLAVAGCGSSDRFDLRTPRPSHTPTVEANGQLAAPRAATPTPTPSATSSHAKPVSRREERVIRMWASALRHGHVAQAARVFALPVLVANGDNPRELHTRAQAKAFNRSLPCGAVIVRLDRTVNHFVVTTFRLVERPGPRPGRCGTGVGHLARTAFLIQHGRITRWVRVADPPPDQSS